MFVERVVDGCHESCANDIVSGIYDNRNMWGCKDVRFLSSVNRLHSMSRLSSCCLAPATSGTTQLPTSHPVSWLWVSLSLGPFLCLLRCHNNNCLFACYAIVGSGSNLPVVKSSICLYTVLLHITIGSGGYCPDSTSRCHEDQTTKRTFRNFLCQLLSYMLTGVQALHFNS